MSLAKRLLHEPIVHFLLAGALLYVLSVWLRDPEEVMPIDSSTVVVDRDAILNFMQFRANAFDPESFALSLDAMSDAEVEEIIDAYVIEEVLYREAQNLNLDASDYIIRQRMVQKMSFLLGDLAGAEAAIDEAELTAYFEENINAYLIKASTTFTHVFFDYESRGEEQAFADAMALQTKFNNAAVGFNDAAGEGDRFPYLRNYVERTMDYVRGHFGAEFSLSLQTLEASDSQWQGPIHSVFGYHVILMTKTKAPAYPELNQVRLNVERDFIQQRREVLLTEITQSVRDRYQIIEQDIRQGNSP